MEVILLERIEKLGQMGDIVNVKPGYARNFLLPQNKALRATEANKSAFGERRSQLEAENLERRQDAERIASDLDGLAVIVVRQASDNDQLYGSVTTRDIATAVTESGVTVDRRQVRLEKPIKTVGMHPIRVSLHPEVTVEIIVNVARSEEEAEMQARGERVNRDGDVVEIDPEDGIEIEDVFDEGAAPDAEQLADGVEEQTDGADAQEDGSSSDEPDPSDDDGAEEPEA